MINACNDDNATENKTFRQRATKYDIFYVINLRNRDTSELAPWFSADNPPIIQVWRTICPKQRWLTALFYFLYKVNDNKIKSARTSLYTIGRSGLSTIVSSKHGLEVSFTGKVMHVKLQSNYMEKVILLEVIIKNGN